jgi:signal transduction histidine kinase
MSRRWLPSSTAGQLVVVVVATTVAAHLAFVAVWIVTHEPHPPIPALYERISQFSRACAAMPAEMCARVAEAASGTGLGIRLADGPPMPAVGPGSVPWIDDLASRFGDALHAGGKPGHMTVGVRLADGMPPPGRWVLFTVDPELISHARPHALNGLLFLLVGIAVPLLGLSVWAVRQIVRPLARLAEATEAIDASAQRSIETGTQTGALTHTLPDSGTSEIRALAGAFNRLLARLQQFLADRTRMLAAISHDLRTPLTRLRLRAEAIEDEGLRERLLKDVRMMELLIGSSLSFLESQERREAEEQLDIGALLQTVCDEFDDAGFDVTFAGPMRLAARCRPRALERAVTNVIENAVKFGGGARVTLRATRAAIEIEVEDEGPGIPEDEKSRVMQPFYRFAPDSAAGEGTRVSQGSGLGLAIANTIITAHGGAIDLQDRHPRGLIVRLVLPRPPGGETTGQHTPPVRIPAE